MLKYKYTINFPVQMDALTRYRAYITIWESKKVTKIVKIYLLRSNGWNKLYCYYLKRDAVQILKCFWYRFLKFIYLYNQSCKFIIFYKFTCYDKCGTYKKSKADDKQKMWTIKKEPYGSFYFCFPQRKSAISLPEASLKVFPTLLIK